jgi:hypothetical protein
MTGNASAIESPTLPSGRRIPNINVGIQLPLINQVRSVFLYVNARRFG